MKLSPQIFGFISIVLGLGFGIFLIETLRRQHSSKRWPTTSGEILESNLEEDSDGWYPHVRYAYTVQKKRYVNDRLHFYDLNSSTKQDAKKHLSLYPVGKVVTIYYNPIKPDQAVLDRQIPLWRHIFWLFFAMFLLVVGVGMLRG